MKQYLDKFKKLSPASRLSLFISVLLFFAVGITISNVITQEKIANAASNNLSKNNDPLIKSSYIAYTYVTPTIYCLGGRPCTSPAPTITNTPISNPSNMPVSITPGQPTETIPTMPVSQTPSTTLAPTTNPCTTISPNASVNNEALHKKNKKKSKGILQQLLELIKWLFEQLWKFLGIGGITPIIEPTLPVTPVPSTALTPQPGTTSTPTTPPCEPTPTTPILTTPLPTTTSTPISSSCIPVETNGNSVDKVDIVFIADQYSSSDLGLFASTVDKAKNHLFTIVPFNNQKTKVNIWRVDSVVNLGCDTYGPQAPSCNTSNFENIASVCPRDVIVISVNKNLRSWATGKYMVLKNSTGHEYTFVHEMGHAFGKLYDEYLSRNSNSSKNPTNGVNCDVAGCPKWSGTSGAVCVQECTYKNWYRSANESIMRVSAGKTDFGIININEINRLFNNNYK